MGKMKYFKIKNFEKYQPKRKGKTAPWIRLYAHWNNDWAIGQLSDSHKAHFTGLLLVAHATNNQIPWDTRWLKTQIQARSNVKIEVFEKLGLIEVLDNMDETQEEIKVPEGRGEEKRRDDMRSETQKKPKVKKTDARQETLINCYFEEFERVFKTPPVMSYARDGKILKGLAESHGDELVKTLIKKFLNMNDPKFINGTGRDVPLFFTNFNKLNIGNQSENLNKKGMPVI